MKRVIFLFTFFTSLIFIISSCQSVEREKSNQVEQRLIFPQYTVSYDAESGNLQLPLNLILITQPVV